MHCTAENRRDKPSTASWEKASQKVSGPRVQLNSTVLYVAESDSRCGGEEQHVANDVERESPGFLPGDMRLAQTCVSSMFQVPRESIANTELMQN